MELSLLARLSKDVRLTSRELSRDEARGLVDMYYKLQHQRIALAGQIRAINQGADEPETTNVLSFFQSQVETLENQIRAALGEYAQKFVAGRWAQSLVGIGPVISAGLLCHIDIAEGAHHARRVGALQLTTLFFKVAAVSSNTICSSRYTPWPPGPRC